MQLAMTLAALLFCSSCFTGCAEDDSEVNDLDSVFFHGSVAEMVIAVLNDDNSEISRVTVSENPGSFDIALPIGDNYRLYFIANDGMTNIAICPLYDGATNVFVMEEGMIIDLGLVDTSTGIALAANSPLDQGAGDGGENTVVPLAFQLAGGWEGNSIASIEEGIPWWMRGFISFYTDGDCFGILDEYDSDPDTIRCSDINDFALEEIAVDLDQTVTTHCSTWGEGWPGSTELSVSLRMAESYQQADMEGNWTCHSLAVGEGAPWWERFSGTIDAEGILDGEAVESNGNVNQISGAFTMSETGIITSPDSPSYRAVLDSGHTVFVGTGSWNSGPQPTTEMKIGLKMGSLYSLADLTGTWKGNALASGAVWWERSLLIVNPDGSFSAEIEDNDGDTDVVSGTLQISVEGIITIDGIPDFEGSLDAAKTVMVWTDTWTTGDPGVAELKVFVKVAAN